MSLSLLRVQKDDSSPHSIDAVYELQHSTPGRDGTTLSLQVCLRVAVPKSIREPT